MEYFIGVPSNAGHAALDNFVAMPLSKTLLLTFLTALASCMGGTTDAPVDRPEPRKDPRDAWQRPEAVIALMGQDLTGTTVADLFAGDGYFTFKLLSAGARVIAIENDPDLAERIRSRKKELGISDEQLQIRVVPEGDPGLAPEEVDGALLVHHFVTLRDRTSYFQLLRRGMRAPRPLYMVEWQDRPTQLGPPPDQRMDSNAIMDELGHLGFTDIGAFSDKVPDQVVYFASDPMESFDELMHRMGTAQ